MGYINGQASKQLLKEAANSKLGKQVMKSKPVKYFTDFIGLTKRTDAIPGLSKDVNAVRKEILGQAAERRKLAYNPLNIITGRGAREEKKAILESALQMAKKEAELAALLNKERSNIVKLTGPNSKVARKDSLGKIKNIEQELSKYKGAGEYAKYVEKDIKGVRDRSILGLAKNNKMALGIATLSAITGGDPEASDEQKELLEQWKNEGGTVEEFYELAMSNPALKEQLKEYGLDDLEALYRLTGLTHADYIENKRKLLEDKYAKVDYTGEGYNTSSIRRRNNANGTYQYISADGKVLTDENGKLTQDAYNYFASLKGKDYANKINVIMGRGGVYQNGKWRADYAPSGNRTADWDTAVNAMSDEEKNLYFGVNGMLNTEAQRDTSHVYDPISGKMIDLSKFDYEKAKNADTEAFNRDSTSDKFFGALGLKGRTKKFASGLFMNTIPGRLAMLNDGINEWKKGNQLGAIADIAWGTTGATKVLKGAGNLAGGNTGKVLNALDKGMNSNWVQYPAMGAMGIEMFRGEAPTSNIVDPSIYYGDELSESDNSLAADDLAFLASMEKYNNGYRKGGKITFGKYVYKNR